MVEYKLIIKPIKDSYHEGWLEIVTAETLQDCCDLAITKVKQAIEQLDCELYVEYAVKL